MTSTYTTPRPTPLSSYDLSGYDDGPPVRRHSPLVDGISIDMEVAREATCSHCGHVGCGYRGFHKLGRDYGYSTSYRAFIVCPVCGHAEEF